MNRQMLKVIGVVILSYIVLYVIISSTQTQLDINGQSVKERIQHDQKQSEYHKLVLEATNMVSESSVAFNKVDLYQQKETVDFASLTEVIDKTIEKLNQAIKLDADPIKLPKADASHHEPSVDSDTELKEKLIELKLGLEDVTSQLQTLHTDGQSATTSTIPSQSISRLYDSFEEISETLESVRSVFTNELGKFEVEVSMTMIQLTWVERFDYSMKRVEGAIVVCCLLSIVMVFLVMKPRRFSIKRFMEN